MILHVHVADVGLFDKVDVRDPCAHCGTRVEHLFYNPGWEKGICLTCLRTETLAGSVNRITTVGEEPKVG